MEAIPDIPAEILAGPTGARVGAFFDLDGTLVQGFTAAVHLGHRIRHRQARLGELTGTLEAALREDAEALPVMVSHRDSSRACHMSGFRSGAKPSRMHMTEARALFDRHLTGFISP